MTRRRKIVLLSIGALGLGAAILVLIYRYSLPPDPVIGELHFPNIFSACTPVLRCLGPDRSARPPRPS
jgi:hypothetical protein